MRIATFSIAAAMLAGVNGAALAQAPDAYPCKIVKFMVSYPPGGTSDMLARLLVPGLTTRLGTTIVVENKSGASGNIGTAEVTGAKADGCTWLLANSTNAVISRNLFKLQRDPMDTLAAVAEGATVPMVLYVNEQVPAKDVKQLVDLLRANPGKYSFASPGAGTPHHLLAELLKLDAGVSANHIPYRGEGPAIQDVLAGHVPFAFGSTTAVVPHFAGGHIRPLATTGEKRSSALPNVPTMKELGYPKFVVTNWYGVFVPKGTPNNLVTRLNSSIREIQKTPEVAEALAKLDSQNVGYDAAQYQQFVQKEGPYWEALVKQTGAKVD